MTQDVSWRSGLRFTARKLFARHKKKLVLCLSGGIDSEFVARILMDADTPFSVKIQRYSQDLNIEDISWAVTFCERNHLSYEFVEFAAEDFFLSDEPFKMCKGLKTEALLFTPTLKLLEESAACGELPILGCGELVLKRKNGTIGVLESERQLLPLRFCRQKRIAAAPLFFREDIRNHLRLLKDPFLLNLLFEGKGLPIDWKYRLYSSLYPMERRERKRSRERLRELLEDRLERKKSFQEKENFHLWHQAVKRFSQMKPDAFSVNRG